MLCILQIYETISKIKYIRYCLKGETFVLGILIKKIKRLIFYLNVQVFYFLKIQY